MSVVRRWCPDRWCDETMPSADAPSRFLVRHGGEWFLEGRAGKAVWSDRVVPGEVVAFSYWETRGRHTIKVNIEGGVSYFNVPVGSGISYWLSGDPETTSDFIEDLVKDCELEEGSHEIEAVFWSDPILFRFEVGTNLGRFTPVDDRAPSPISLLTRDAS